MLLYKGIILLKIHMTFYVIIVVNHKNLSLNYLKINLVIWKRYFKVKKKNSQNFATLSKRVIYCNMLYNLFYFLHNEIKTNQ